MSALDDIRMHVMWNRLISVVEEQALTLLRTALSTSVREAGDLSAGVFDPDGRMLAQAVTGTPGHVNTMAEAVPHFIAAIPVAEMLEGDTYVTNDPRHGTGHPHDITMVSPSFLDGELVGFFACTAHVVDVGGRGFGADGKSVYEEGIQIPIVTFARQGQVNRDLVRMVRANVREPNQVVGDFHSLAACNEVGHRRLVAMLRELGLASLAPLRDFIFSRTAAAMREKIAALPEGTWSNAMTTDGYDDPIALAAAVTIAADHVHFDFAGSGPVSRWGINVPHHLHQGLRVLRVEMRGRARRPHQRRLAGLLHGVGAGQRAERRAAGPGGPAPRARPHGAGPRARCAAWPHPRRGRSVAVGRPPFGAPAARRAEAAGGGADVQLRRHGRAPGP